MRSKIERFKRSRSAGVVVALAVGIAAAMGLGSCKRQKANVATGGAPSAVRAPRLEPNMPTTQELAKESRAHLLEGFYDMPSLGKGSAFVAPDGENWDLYSNGMMIHELRPSTDSTSVKLGQKAYLAITGRLAEAGGRVFLKKTADDPLVIELGSKKVPQGLSLGVMGMKISGKRRVFVPQSLAYATAGSSEYGIQPFQDLIYDIELVDVQGEALPVWIEDLPRFEPLGPPAPGVLGKATSQPASAPADAGAGAGVNP